jgi:Recombinase zinc beta ribbon domain
MIVWRAAAGPPEARQGSRCARPTEPACGLDRRPLARLFGLRAVMASRERVRSRYDASEDRRHSVAPRKLRSFCRWRTHATLAPWLALRNRDDYRYYTCSTKARQGETGCTGRTVPMDKLDRVVADHIEHRLLQPKRLEEILSSVLDRREERAERRATHIAELRKRMAEADAKLKRLYDAIESGVADLSDPMLKDRVDDLKAIRDQAHADAERAQGAIERLGPSITAQALKTFARHARKRMRTEGGGYRRDHLRALAHRSRREGGSHHGVEKRCFARSSPLQAQKPRLLACPVLYRSGAPEEIRTPDPQIRSLALHPAGNRAGHRARATRARQGLGEIRRRAALNAATAALIA